MSQVEIIKEKLLNRKVEKKDFLINLSQLQTNDGQLFTINQTTNLKPVYLDSHAHTQLLQKLGIPGHYWNKCNTDLRLINLNYWLEKKKNDEVLVRLYGDNVRAILSKRFQTFLDTNKIAPLFLDQVTETLTKKELDFLVVHNIGDGLKNNAIDEIAITIPGLSTTSNNSNLEYTCGFRFTNSEVGLRSLKIEPIITLKHTGMLYNAMERNTNFVLKSAITFRHSNSQVNPSTLKWKLIDEIPKMLEATQAHIGTLLKAEVEDVNAQSTLDKLVRKSPMFPVEIKNLLDDKYESIKLVNKMQMIKSIIDSVKNLPLYKQLFIEKEVSKFMGLHKDYQDTIDQILDL